MVVCGCADESESDSGAGSPYVDGPDAPTAPPSPHDPSSPSDPNDPSNPITPSSEGICGELTTALEGVEDECAKTLTMTCESVLGIINPDYLAAVSVCMDGGSDVLTCLAEGFANLAPKLAHLTLAEAFCEECALDVPGCEEVFFIDGEAAGIGVLTLPFSEELIAEVTAECTDGFTCALDFPSCAREVIEAHIPGIEDLFCVADL